MYRNGYTSAQLEEQKHIIYENTLISIKILVKQSEELGHEVAAVVSRDVLLASPCVFGKLVWS